MEAEGRGVMQQFERSTLPWSNCTVMVNSLPTGIFLGLGGIYMFTVDLVINPLLAGVLTAYVVLFVCL